MIDKKVLQVMNLRARLVKAIVENAHQEQCDICQEILDAGIEVEELNLFPSMMSILENNLLAMKWSPKLSGSVENV